MFDNNEKDGILLESGTNELEIVMFTVGSGTFGINVLKVREILNPVPVTETPNGHENVEGVIRLREDVIPVINLAKVLGLPPSEHQEQDKFIIAELNQMKVAFHVHSVSRIHRISWEQIEKPSELSQGVNAHTIGIVKMDEGMSLLLDYEKIVVDISPESGVNVDSLKVLGKRERSNKNIVVAEDSPILRKLLEDTLAEAGYENIRFFDDGKGAWDYLTECVDEENKELTSDIHLVLTDIEMPKMDGHHLTLKIKEHSVLKDLPVIIFSSLITGDLFHKGEKVGANAQVSKPEIVQLVETIDEHIL
ncbi:chemotaxis protein [Desertibacillus haloalkaliphilus]|uniref:chemotaxis protein n=1 Tax=Desertibacillus haloalkaliphilus TaxID=1328930 RepID=UPI001C2562E4|nr:chemotaxis protein [Desertibacillus haloalkaliphilus]MBU8907462.1 chemotaxis protein [Desertibacillus haloalkaliphilus]